MTNNSQHLILQDGLGNIIGYTNDPRSGVLVQEKNPKYVEFLQKLAYVPTVWEQIRSQRDSILKESDWIDLPNSPVKNKESWLTYRQALRDLPQNFSSPEEVVWPNKPE